jgi:hypothetical protein
MVLRSRARLKALLGLLSVLLLAGGAARASGLVGSYAQAKTSSKNRVTLSKPKHRRLAPGSWVGTATDTVTATAAEKHGSGIAYELIRGTHARRAPRSGPKCRKRCPLRYTGRLTYSTAKMPAGADKLSLQAVSAGGARSSVRAWKLNVDHGRPTIGLSGALAQSNNATVDIRSYGLGIRVQDTNGSKPSSGISQVSVYVDGKPQSGVSGYRPCAYARKCPGSAAASWTFVASRYAAGKRTITVAVADSAHNVTTQSVVVTVAPRMFWGASIGTQFTGGQPPFDWKAESDFAKLDAGGKMPSIVDWGQSWNASQYCNSATGYPAGHFCGFQTSLFNDVRQRGFVPFLTWGSSDDNYYDTNFTDAAIAHGSEDAYLRKWAQDAKAWGHPFFLRFDSEMNGGWWNYGTGRHPNGSPGPNSAEDFVAMWRHVHDIFTQVGANNVTWVWCPNYVYAGEQALDTIYPGDAYVDWTCTDAYNGDNPWKSFADLFGPTYDQLTQIAPDKPVFIAETSSTAAGGSKPDWITQMFNDLPTKLPKIRGFLWFDVASQGPGNHYDWPIEGSDVSHPDTASINAFTDGISSQRYTTNNFSQLDGGSIRPPT